MQNIRQVDPTLMVLRESKMTLGNIEDIIIKGSITSIKAMLGLALFTYVAASCAVGEWNPSEWGEAYQTNVEQLEPERELDKPYYPRA